MLERKFDGTGAGAVEELAVEGSCGKEGGSWQTMENAGNEAEMLKSTDFLRRIIAPAGGQGGVTLSYLCRNCNSFRTEDYMWWISAGKKHCSWWCAICGEKHDWRAPNRLLVVQTGASASQA